MMHHFSCSLLLCALTVMVIEVGPEGSIARVRSRIEAQVKAGALTLALTLQLRRHHYIARHACLLARSLLACGSGLAKFFVTAT
jgi:hypothetical protein